MKILHRRKKQNPNHVLIRITKALNLPQKEIQDSLGISLDTFKNIVYHKPKSWDKHAAIVSRATGVAVKSLLANNPRKPLLCFDGQRWTIKKYSDWIARPYVENKIGSVTSNRSQTLLYFRMVMIKVARLLLAAYRAEKTEIAFVKLLRPLMLQEVNEHRKSLTPSSTYEQWIFEMHREVFAIDECSPQGMEIIFGRFLREIIKEEKRQLQKIEMK
jgi:hypothetical protein